VKGLSKAFRWFSAKAAPERLQCARCDGHGCIAIYDISDEYAVPCPRCKPSEFMISAKRREWSLHEIERALAEAGRLALHGEAGT
jgi:Zn finger protein HypA/HybF involved in hydrogenase expression